ncbi:TPA: hypothetical protein ACIBRT_003777 [Salmonella enterica subsp. enterica serovar Aberdeen]
MKRLLIVAAFAALSAVTAAHAEDKTIFSLACTQQDAHGKIIDSGKGIVIFAKADQFGYGYATTNTTDTKTGSFGETHTYFLGGNQPKGENIVLYTTRQNKEDINQAADFLAIKQIDQQSAYVALTRLKNGKDVIPGKIFYCNFM